MNPNNLTLLIGLITKNNLTTLPDVLKNVETYASVFLDYNTLIVDGWSTDGSFDYCQNWSAKDKDKRKCILQQSFSTQRMDNLVEARNTVLEYFKTKFNNTTLLLLLDADSPNVPPLDLKGFLTCFDNQDDWVALFVNQPNIYYDLWALRDSELDMDYQIKYKHLSWNGEIQAVLRPYNQPKTSTTGFWPVKSAFGGAGLYKTDVIKKTNAFYKATTIVNENLVSVCEHVPFHEALLKHGGKMFINCNWINGDHQ
jgi:hypothetical protein